MVEIRGAGVGKFFAMVHVILFSAVIFRLRINNSMSFIIYMRVSCSFFTFEKALVSWADKYRGLANHHSFALHMMPMPRSEKQSQQNVKLAQGPDTAPCFSIPVPRKAPCS
jgi:hypothetical protein